MALTVERCFNSNLSHLFQKSGIDKLLPEMKMDDFLFSPIGYSMNGITAAQKHENLENSQSSGKHRDPSFVTVHVTPQVLVHQSLLFTFQSQPSCSYASFETNSCFSSIELVCQVFCFSACNINMTKIRDSRFWRFLTQGSLS